MKREHFPNGCPDFRRLEGLSRREVLQAGGLGLLGLTLPALLRAQSQTGSYLGEQPRYRLRMCL